MNTTCCPSCGKSLPISANFCAACGKTITSPEQQAVLLEYAPTHHAYATADMQNVGDDLSSSPTVTYYPVTHPSSRFPAVKGSLSQRLSDARMPKTDPPRWPDDEDDADGGADDGADNAFNNLNDEGLFYEGTWHKELDAPSLHLHDLPSPRPSSPYPVVLRRPRFPRRTRKSSFVLLFWSGLVLFMLILAGSFGLATNWGHTLLRAGIPTLQASATTLAPGDTLTLHGSHFTPNGRVGLTRDASILINDTNGTNIVQANAQGDFTDSIIIVDDWQAGSHVVNAEDAVRHKIAQVSFLITGTTGSARPARFKLSTTTLNMGIGDLATNSQETLMLTNIGGGQLTWKGTSSQPWLMLTPNNGTLASGQKTQVTIAVDRSGMAPGAYSGQILFASDAGNTTLSVSMQVIPLSIQSDAVLSLSPAVLAFNGTDGASSPASQTLTVSNLGAQALQWNVTSNQSWLSASPTSGNAQGAAAASTSSLAGNTGQASTADLSRLMENPGQGATQQSVAVSVNTSSMLPGTYNAMLTFTASEPNGQVKDGTQTIPVSLTVQPQCTIQVAPSLVSFAAVYQQASPSAKTITITSSQGCTTPVKWSVTGSASWLSVSNASGTTPMSPQVSVNIAGLAPGTYNSSLVFTTSAGTQTLPVSLSIAQPAAPAMSVSASTLSYSAIAGASSPPSQAVTLSNSGGSTLSWQATAATSVGGNWLTISSASGAVASQQSTTLSIGATLGTLVPGTYTGTVTFTGTDGAGHAAAGSPQVIQISFVVSAPCGVTTMPTALTFVGVTGQASVTPQPVTLTASGACADPLNWSAVSSSAWLVPTATTGSFSLSSAGTINVGVSLTGLAPGTYSATLTVTTTDSVTKAVIGAPQKIAVTLTVQTPCTLSSPSKTTLSFAADAGQSAGSQTFTVSVSGSCVGVVTLTPTISVSSGTGWLAVTPGSASVTVGGSATFTVSASAASLTSGNYTGSISLAGVNGSASIAGSPQVVGVTLTVTSPPVLAASAGSASIHGTYGVTSQPVVIANSGGGTLNWSATAGSGTPSFLSLSATSGSLAAGANTSINMVANTPNVTSGNYTINVTVTATEAVSGAVVSGSPTTVAIAVTVAPPTMQVSTTSLSYSMQAGTNPAAQSITITNGGGGTLTWSIGSISARWLSVNPVSGSDTAGQSSSVTFSVHAASLAAGTYNATAVITPSAGQPVTINVNLVVSAPPTPTPTATAIITPGVTATVGFTPTPTATTGVTPTATMGVTPTPTATAGVTPTATATASATASTTATLASTTMETSAAFAIPPAKPAVS